MSIDLTIYTISEIPARAVRTYVVQDIPYPDGRPPVAVATYKTINSLDFIEAGPIMDWIRENRTPHETFQIFPLTYIVFYDMADVLMFKLAVVHQD
jgi:hypothetical protein